VSERKSDDVLAILYMEIRGVPAADRGVIRCQQDRSARNSTPIIRTQLDKEYHSTTTYVGRRRATGGGSPLLCDSISLLPYCREKPPSADLAVISYIYIREFFPSADLNVSS